ncbi:Hsp20/alpha crystallin family protein [Candidatus Chlorohelix sp.]|uniref:Hsp20/alpha crystallin family protein n=1 Tax=Candidatus Chlorohelix sp. TaxID=3139201 RepID=UPI00305D5930
MSENRNNKTGSFGSYDPDANDEEYETSRASRNTKRTTGSSGSGSINMGGFFKGLGEIAERLNEVVEKAEELSRKAKEAEASGNGSGGELKSEFNSKGFVVKWGFNNSTLEENPGAARPFASRPPGFANRSAVRPVTTPGHTTPAKDKAGQRPNPNTSNLTPVATVREPYVEIHDEASESQILVIVELPGVEEERVWFEIHDDILLVRGENTDCLYEKEVMLPAMVKAEPVSQQYQNGLLELRLKRA